MAVNPRIQIQNFSTAILNKAKKYKMCVLKENFIKVEVSNHKRIYSEF